MHVFKAQFHTVLARYFFEHFKTLPDEHGVEIRVAFEPALSVKSVRFRAYRVCDGQDFAIHIFRVVISARRKIEKLRLELGVERVNGIYVKVAFALFEKVSELLFVLAKSGEKNLASFSPTTLNDRERILGQFFQKNVAVDIPTFIYSSSSGVSATPPFLSLSQMSFCFLTCPKSLGMTSSILSKGDSPCALAR